MKLNILILSVQTPFTRGGAEILVEQLCKEIALSGHNVDIISLPFNALPKEDLIKQIAMWRALDLQNFGGKKIDLAIATKFPSYMARHPKKVVWMIHQHRQLYELYGSRFGDFSTSSNDEALRRMLISADEIALKEANKIYTISPNVSERLKRFNNIDSDTLMPALPLGDRYYSESSSNYILSVGRLCSIKRIDLLIRALPLIEEKVTLKIVGVADEPAFDDYIRSEVRKHGIEGRVEFLGRVEENDLLKLYANSLAVYYAPFDEDYGFVTLEALASSKAVVTAHDSGGVLQFIKDGINGYVVAPIEQEIARAFNRLYRENMRRTLNIEKIQTNSWEAIIDRLLSAA